VIFEYFRGMEVYQIGFEKITNLSLILSEENCKMQYIIIMVTSKPNIDTH
jgi:hypothetical protein